MEQNITNHADDLVSCFKEKLDLKPIDIRAYSPLTLAYIGDSVYDLLIRTESVCRANMQTNKYHKSVSKIVCAKAQADMIEALLNDLTEEEAEVYRRGRNATVYTKAKNATHGEYHKATGFEAVLGLYLFNGFKNSDLQTTQE